MNEKGLFKYLGELDYQSLVFSKPVSEQAEAYSKILIEAQNQFVPTRQIVVRPKDQDWCNSYTRLLIRSKNRNYQFFKKASTQHKHATTNPNMQPHLVTRLKAKADKAHEVYRTSSNESTKANRRAKLAFYNTVNQTMHNSQISAKKKFSILSRLLKTQKISSVPPIIENGEVVTDAQAKCNLFNNFFSSKATVPGNDDPVPYLEPRTDIKEPLSNFNTSPFELADILRNIKKSNFSHCGIPGHFLALVATPVSFQLYRVFNNKWEAGIFADIFKVGHVCCIYKRSGLKSDKSSWRPVTLLPSLSKCAEAVMHRRLLSHLSKIISYQNVKLLI